VIRQRGAGGSSKAVPGGMAVVGSRLSVQRQFPAKKGMGRGRRDAGRGSRIGCRAFESFDLLGQFLLLGLEASFDLFDIYRPFS